MTDEQQSAPAEVGSAQGLQFGPGNMQFNLWLNERKIDAQRVEALSASAAASYVARLSAEDAAFVLANAAASASAGVLRFLASKPRHKKLVIEIIAHINRAKAQELIAAIGAAAAELELLPDAAEAIAEYEDTGVPELGEPIGGLTIASASPQGTRGYYQNFQDGQIHWSVRSGAQPTRGANAVYHIGLGGSGGRLGFPITPDTQAQRSPFGTEGSWQRFESSRNYDDRVCGRLGVKCGATVYWSAHGSHATWGSIGKYYETHGGTGGPLGFPIGDEAKVGPSRREVGPGTVGWSQCFEGGTVYYAEKTNAIFVPSLISEHHERHGGVTGSLGFPVSPELQTAESPNGTAGRFQRFEARRDYRRDILACWSDIEGPGGATIYVSEEHGAHCVGWGNGHFYEKSGGTGGWLGFPLSDENRINNSDSEPRATIQEFEGGTIYFKEKYGSVPVTRQVADFLKQHEELGQRLGFPIKAERPLDPERKEIVQFYENGVVTIRAGMIEAWFR